MIPVPLGDPRTAFLVDLSARTRGLFHVLQPSASPEGEPVAVTAAFSKWFVETLVGVDPAFLAVAADPRASEAAETPEEARRARYWRAGIWPGYKAGREAPGPEYEVQVDRCAEVLTAHRVPVYRADGIEADDWIGALAPKLRRAGLRVVIVSKDHDLYQLVRGEEIVCWTGDGKDLAITEADVVKRYGVSPALLPAALALAGDGDETPKLEGVGEKTAARLIERHLQHAAPNITARELLDLVLRFWSWESTKGGGPSKVGRALRDGADTARLALRLVELGEDIVPRLGPVHVDISEMRVGWDEADAARVRAIGDETDIAILRGCEWKRRAPLPEDVLRRWMETEAAEEAANR